ncbi:hypothetical protein BLA6860_00765 [Burkholderia lata]|nr:hypothetical protein BLA6860_00765 [Burkholderia lata]
MKIKENFHRQSMPPRSSLPALAPAKSSAKRTKHCPMPPSLPDDNANIKPFSTDRKLTGDSINSILSRKRLRHQYKRFTATLCRPHYFQYIVNSIVNSRSQIARMSGRRNPTSGPHRMRERRKNNPHTFARIGDPGDRKTRVVPKRACARGDRMKERPGRPVSGERYRWNSGMDRRKRRRHVEAYRHRHAARRAAASGDGYYTEAAASADAGDQPPPSARYSVIAFASLSCLSRISSCPDSYVLRCASSSSRYVATPPA